MAQRILRIAIPVLERILTQGECLEPVNVPRDLKIAAVRMGPGDTIELDVVSQEFSEPPAPRIAYDDEDRPYHEVSELQAMKLPELDLLFAAQFRRRCDHPGALR